MQLQTKQIRTQSKMHLLAGICVCVLSFTRVHIEKRQP